MNKRRIFKSFLISVFSLVFFMIFNQKVVAYDEQFANRVIDIIERYDVEEFDSNNIYQTKATKQKTERGHELQTPTKHKKTERGHELPKSQPQSV